MSITVDDIITNFNTYISDETTNRISDDERLQYITEATTWLQKELGNDHMNATYDFEYFDRIHRYKITSNVPDLFDVSDLTTRDLDEHKEPFDRKPATELRLEIGLDDTDNAYAVERKNDDWFLLVNYHPDDSAKQLASFDSTTADGGTWELDSSGSDATNLTQDDVEYKQGGSCLNFDIDVSQSANDRATIKNTALSTKNLSDYEDLGSLFLWIYLPDTTNINSVSLYWGSDSFNYWNESVTTDYAGESFADGWNRLQFEWSQASQAGSPDVTAIDFIQININYAGGQADDTDLRVDDLFIANPNKLTFHYLSWYVGQDNGGSDLTAFSATTDVPFFSDKNDNYRYPVAHKAAGLAMKGKLRLSQEGAQEEAEAQNSLEQYRPYTSTSRRPESHSFKPHGINFARRRGR